MHLDIRILSVSDMPDLANYMTTNEAADALGYHVIYVRQMLRDEKIKGQKVGNMWFVYKPSVKEFLEKTAGMEKHDPRRGQEEQ